MSILALGVSYRRAPVDLLERLAFGEDDHTKAYRRFRDLPAIQEAVVLSTCNRVEVYARVTTYHAGFLELKRFLSEAREVDPEEFAEPLYAHYEEEAAEHLFSVAAGIDSMVLGEPQILSQVRQAFLWAEEEGATGPILSALFRGAIRTGRRARAETAIGASPAAFVEAGAGVAAETLGGLGGRSVAMVGAGGMAALAAQFLRGQGLSRLRILNRSVDRAERLAARSGGSPHGLDRLGEAIAEADLVVSSTGAAGVVIGSDLVEEALRGSARDTAARPLFFLDLAVPRDVDPAVALLPGVHLVDIDDLRVILDAARVEEAAEVDQVRAIVAQEVARFRRWRQAARLAPLIQALQAKGARTQAAELARAAPRLADLTERERQAVEALASSIVAKLLHEPIARLKEQAGPGGEQHARTLAELFGIEFHPGD